MKLKTMIKRLTVTKFGLAFDYWLRHFDLMDTVTWGLGMIIVAPIMLAFKLKELINNFIDKLKNNQTDSFSN